MTDYNDWALKKQLKARKSHHYWAAGIADSFTNALCNVMAEQRISQTQLAEKSGVSKAYISKVLNGNTNFTVESMAKLALALGQKVEDIKLSDVNKVKSSYAKFKATNVIQFGQMVNCPEPATQDDYISQYEAS